MILEGELWGDLSSYLWGDLGSDLGRWFGVIWGGGGDVIAVH